MTEDSNRVIVDPSSVIKFTQWRGATYDIWAFVRGVAVEDDVLAEQWPDDYDGHLTRRPNAPFVGCKFCTQFG